MATKKSTTTESNTSTKSNDLQGFLNQAAEYVENDQPFLDAFPDVNKVLKEPLAQKATVDEESAEIYTVRKQAATQLTVKRAEVLLRNEPVQVYWQTNNANTNNRVTGFSISGRVVDTKDAQGLPGISLQAVDLDRERDDLLGQATSDLTGNFAFHFPASAFDDPDQIPEVYIEVLDAKGKMLTRTAKSFEDKTPSGTEFVISLPSDMFPQAVARKEKILQGRSEEILRLQRSARSLDIKLTVPDGIIPVGSLRKGVIGPGANDNPIDRKSTATSNSNTGNTRDTNSKGQADTLKSPSPSPEAGSSASTPGNKTQAPDNFSDIPGIGTKKAEALVLNNISSFQALANSEPDDVAKVLSVSNTKAKEFIKEANKRSQVK